MSTSSTQAQASGAPAGWETLRIAADHAFARATIRLLGVRFRRELHAMVPLALYFENDLFPALRKRKVQTVFVEISPNDDDVLLVGPPNECTVPVSGVGHLARRLKRHGLTRMEFDTSLEYGQIVDAVLIFCHAETGLDGAGSATEGYTGWRSRRIAAAMGSEDGYSRFCMQLRYCPKRRVFSVRHDYCPLILSLLVQRFTLRAKRFADHRALFWLAPRAAVLFFILFSIPAIVLAYFPMTAVASIVLLAAVAAVCTGVGLYTVGAIQYDKEQHEAIRDSYMERIEQLSRYPETNPDLILRIEDSGEVSYANPAARTMLREAGLGEEDWRKLLPEKVDALVRECFRVAPEPHHIEFAIGERIVQYTFSAYPHDKAIIAAGSDVSYLKIIESELRALNENLEGVVRERTRELQLTQDVTLLSLADLAERRDEETGHHLERTRHYVRALAIALREHPRFREAMSDDAIERAFKSAPLHDIGKVAVPDAVLRKPDRLTEEEYDVIKLHPIHGGDALRLAEERLGFNSFLAMAQDIAYYHHERWDGKGYPYGVREEAIPWPARLMALADVYDALTSVRRYKAAWSHEQARDEIVERRGTHFDPDVVDAFLAVEDEFIRIAEEFADKRGALLHSSN